MKLAEKHSPYMIPRPHKAVLQEEDHALSPEISR